MYGERMGYKVGVYIRDLGGLFFKCAHTRARVYMWIHMSFSPFFAHCRARFEGFLLGLSSSLGILPIIVVANASKASSTTSSFVRNTSIAALH